MAALVVRHRAARLLRLKAEIVLGVLLAVRHRAVWLAGLLALVTVMAAGGRPGTTLVAAGSVAAVAASRILAPGAALTAARWSGGPAWLAPAGRLLGVWSLVVPVIAVVIGMDPVPPAGPSGLALGLVAALFTAAVAAATAALAPFTGSSVAGAIGLLAVWFGTISPAGVATLLSEVPAAQRAAVLLWHWLPLDWRATRWLATGGVEHLVLLAGWIGGGLLLASLGVIRGAERPRVRGGAGE